MKYFIFTHTYNTSNNRTTIYGLIMINLRIFSDPTAWKNHIEHADCCSIPPRKRARTTPLNWSRRTGYSRNSGRWSRSIDLQIETIYPYIIFIYWWKTYHRQHTICKRIRIILQRIEEPIAVLCPKELLFDNVLSHRADVYAILLLQQHTDHQIHVQDARIDLLQHGDAAIGHKTGQIFPGCDYMAAVRALCKVHVIRTETMVSATSNVHGQNVQSNAVRVFIVEDFIAYLK